MTQTSLMTVEPSAPLASHRVRRATLRINDIVGGATLELALAIGRIVIDELYGGDLDAWRERGAKECTLRQLARDPMLQISASSLYRAIAIYALKTRLGEHKAWELLTTCHIRAVLGLPEREQRRLLDQAIEEDMSSPEFEKVTAEVRRRTKGSRGGRPRKPRFVRSIEYAEKALADEDKVFGDLDALNAMTPAQRVELGRRLSLVRQRCEELTTLIAS